MKCFSGFLFSYQIIFHVTPAEIKCTCCCCVLHACLKHCCCFRVCILSIFTSVLINIMLYVTHTLLNIYLILFCSLLTQTTGVKSPLTQHVIISKDSAYHGLYSRSQTADRPQQRLSFFSSNCHLTFVVDKWHWCRFLFQYFSSSSSSSSYLSWSWATC